MFQTKSLEANLREAEASLSAANSRLSALGQALGAPSLTELQAALDSRLAELSDAGTELRETRRRLQVRLGLLPCDRFLHPVAGPRVLWHLFVTQVAVLTHDQLPCAAERAAAPGGRRQGSCAGSTEAGGPAAQSTGLAAERQPAGGRISDHAAGAGGGSGQCAGGARRCGPEAAGAAIYIALLSLNIPCCTCPASYRRDSRRSLPQHRPFPKQKLTHSINAGQALTETRKLLAEARDRLQQREGELTELQTALQDAVRLLQMVERTSSIQNIDDCLTSTAMYMHCRPGPSFMLSPCQHVHACESVQLDNAGD